MMKSFKQELLDYLYQYYVKHRFSVIPIKTDDTKHPAIRWMGYQYKHPTEEDLSKWFLKGTYNIAIVVGYISRLIVIDADNQNTIDLLKDFDLLNETAQVKTRRGIHYYLRIKDWPEGLKIKTKPIQVKQGEEKIIGLDIKSTGYVIAPPSIINGHRYTFIKGLDHLKDITLDEYHLLVKEIEKKVYGDVKQEKQTKQRKKVLNIDLSQIKTGLEGDRFEPLKQYILTEYKIGKRHNIVLGLAGVLRKKGLSKDLTLSIVIDIAKRANDEELYDRILCVESVYNHDIKDVAGIKWLRQLGYDGRTLRTLLDNIIQSQDIPPQP